ncbi:ETX/MTX2 family pore-forming toxin [Enterococcus sp. UD-01]|jgi:hypothetical protein|uniref:ETX/MTX2 family pore-forming toxin n=1 Tax=Enterococcus sp. UD-01 TaxID=3373911 RepID=UPI00383963CE
MLKKVVVSLGILGAVLGSSLPAYAASAQEIDVKKELESVAKDYGKTYHQLTNSAFNLNWIIRNDSYYLNNLGEYSENWASLDKVEMGQSKSLTAGTKTLENSTSKEQPLTTDSVAKEYANSLSTATTHGVKLGYSATATMNFPFVSGSMTASAEYNFSNTATDTKSEKITYVSPSQTFNVPAHTTYIVEQSLEIGKAKGTISLNSRISPDFRECYGRIITSNTVNYPTVKVGEALRQLRTRNASAAPNLILEEDNSIVAKGTGTFEAEYGTNFKVKVYEVQNVKGRSLLTKKKLVKELTVPAEITGNKQ